MLALSWLPLINLRKNRKFWTGFYAIASFFWFSLFFVDFGYFAYLKYNSESNSISTAKRLLAEQSILSIPGEMFFPNTKNLFVKEKRSIRLAFANSSKKEIFDLLKRLKNFIL